MAGKKRISSKWTDRLLWAGIGVTTGMILFLVPVARQVQRSLEYAWGSGVYLLLSAFFAAAGIVLFFRYVWRHPHPWRQAGAFALVAGVYAWQIVRLPVQAERFHLIEYGLLAALVALAAARRQPGMAALGWALAATLAVGLADELYQWACPERVGEWRDVVINLKSGGMALAALALVARPESLLQRSTWNAWRKLFAVFSVLSIASGAFILKVHVFGYEIVDAEAGRFRSAFTADNLLHTTPEAYRAFCRSIEKEPDPKKRRQMEDRRRWYMREGREHFDRMMLLLMGQKNLPEACMEYRILHRYYTAFLDAAKRMPPRYMIDSCKDFPVNTTVTSRVMDWIVVGVNRGFVIILTVIISTLFFGLAMVPRRDERQAGEHAESPPGSKGVSSPG